MTLAGTGSAIQKDARTRGWDSWLAGIPLDDLKDREERAGWLAADDSYGAVGLSWEGVKNSDENEGSEGSE